MKKEKIKWVIFLTNLFRFLLFFFLDSRLNIYLYIAFRMTLLKCVDGKVFSFFCLLKTRFYFPYFLFIS